MTGKRLLLSALVFGGLLGATGQIHADTSTTSTSSSKVSLLKTIKQAKSKTNKGYPKYHKVKLYVEDKPQMGGGRYNYYRFKSMQKVMHKASKVYKNSKASVQSVNKVNTQLKTALANLVDQKSYYKADKIFEALKRDNYTAATFKALSQNTLDYYYNTKDRDFTQKDYNEAVKDFYNSLHKLKKHKWGKTNKLWGKVKKTGKFYKFYDNKDAWGRKVVDYYYLDKGKYKKQPFAYVILDSQDGITYNYTVYRLDNNHTEIFVHVDTDKL